MQRTHTFWQVCALLCVWAVFPWQCTPVSGGAGAPCQEAGDCQGALRCVGGTCQGGEGSGGDASEQSTPVERGSVPDAKEVVSRPDAKEALIADRRVTEGGGSERKGREPAPEPKPDQAVSCPSSCGSAQDCALPACGARTSCQQGRCEAPGSACPATCQRDEECPAAACGARTRCIGGQCQEARSCPSQCAQDTDCNIALCGNKRFCIKGTCQEQTGVQCPSRCTDDIECMSIPSCCPRTKCRNGVCTDTGCPCKCNTSADCQVQGCTQRRCMHGVCI